MFEKLKEEVKSAKARAVLKVNEELTMTYHYIGSQILSFEAKRDKEKLVEQLSQDFKNAFPACLVIRNIERKNKNRRV